MFKNSRGQKDFLLTACVLSLTTVLFKTIASGAVIFGHQLGTMDATLAGVILGATLGSYTTKRIAIAKQEKAP